MLKPQAFFPPFFSDAVLPIHQYEILLQSLVTGRIIYHCFFLVSIL